MSLCHILLTGVSPQVPNTSGRTTCIDVPDGEGGSEGRFCLKADARQKKVIRKFRIIREFQPPSWMNVINYDHK